MVSRESGARTLCLQCQLVAGSRLQFRWCFWGLSANLRREPLKTGRTIYMIYVSDCLDNAKMFGAMGAGKPLKLLVTCDQNLSVGHRMLWPSHYGMAFVSNPVDFEDQSFGETVSASERPPTVLAVDMLPQIRVRNSTAVCQEPSLNLASEDYNKSIGWAPRRNAEWSKCCNFLRFCGQS